MNAQWVITILLAVIAWLLKEGYSWAKTSWSQHIQEEKTRWQTQEKKEKERDEAMANGLKNLSAEFKEVSMAFHKVGDMIMEETGGLKEDVGALKERVDIHELEIKQLKVKVK